MPRVRPKKRQKVLSDRRKGGTKLDMFADELILDIISQLRSAYRANGMLHREGSTALTAK